MDGKLGEDMFHKTSISLEVIPEIVIISSRCLLWYVLLFQTFSFAQQSSPYSVSYRAGIWWSCETEFERSENIEN